MMPKTPLFLVLVAALLVNNLPCCSAEDVYCVTPTATSCSSCPRDSTHCATLTEYAQEAALYFTSNTTMVFLPGDHVLDLNITVANVASLTMHGESSLGNVPTVVCSGPVGLLFSNMVDFKMYSLAVRSCNRSLRVNDQLADPASNSALFLISTQSAELANCSFHDNPCTALAVHNTSITLAENTFEKNQCGITALNSNLLFTGNTTFFGNGYSSSEISVDGLAGAILGLASSLHFNGSNNFTSNANLARSEFGSGGTISAINNTSLSFTGINTFNNNSALSGGVIYAANNASVSFNGTSKFTNNSADSEGGAIYAQYSVVFIFSGNSNFIGNSAPSDFGGYGGAIYASTDTSMSFTGVSNFSNNLAGFWGGAINVEMNTIISFSGTNVFNNNSAFFGGGISAQTNTSVSFTGSSYFNNGFAIAGGAILAPSNASICFNGISSFSNNSARGQGGAINAASNTVSFNGTSSFINNSAYSGGALYTSDNALVSFRGASNFDNNNATQGGAISAANNTLSFTGISNFNNNSAQNRGGAIYAANNASVGFNGTIDNSFTNNSANSEGGAIYAQYSVVFIFSGNSNFIGNSAPSDFGGYGGAIYASTDTSMSFTGVSNFSNNLAGFWGGAINVEMNTIISFSGTNVFNNNSAFFGGGISAQTNTSVSFTGSSYFNNGFAIAGGAILAPSNASICFNGISSFSNNSARGQGGAINAASNTVSFNGTSSFINNSAYSGGALYTSDNALVSFRGASNFDNNNATQGGAISATNNTLMVEGTMNFTSNGNDRSNDKNSLGGGMYLSRNSTFQIFPNTTVYWENNRAGFGGAIYVDDNSNPFVYCTQTEKCTQRECFFQLPGQNISNSLDAQLVFKNNTAAAAGSVLYGGAVDNCKLTGLDSYSSGEVFDMLVDIENDHTNSSISSLPFRVCPCENSLPDCEKSELKYAVYPGERFQVSVVAVGQRDGTVAAEIESRVLLSGATLLSSQYTQYANNTCTTLDYTVFSLSKSAVVELYADFPCSTFSYVLNVSLTINQTCPPGFIISESKRACICEQRLERYTNNCNITSEKITRESFQQFWAGYDDQSHGLILNPLCPLDYCASQTVVFPLNNTDIQCANNRSGLLCGACKKNYSLVLGTSRCKACTNSYLALLIPFAVMGIALVFLLLVCKLTVATGTLSGLVFYANIVGVNRTIFLPLESTDPLSVFVAWLNLDFGIETCFFDGMDAYGKTWLQFVFPVYIWLLVGLMIVISRFSNTFAKLLGKNPVSVLATLVLLSYAKILRTLISAIYVTYLEYPTYNRGVWLYDANVDYLVGKHIPLFIVAVLVFIFLFLPYTLLLLFGQWLQTISHLRLFSWVNRLKPFMDSYHAPYKAKHRYWPGLLLVLRFVLLLVFALNPQEDPSIILLAILVGAGILHLWAWFSGGVYRNWRLDALEGSFFVNMTILAAATYHVKYSDSCHENYSVVNQYAVWYTSVSIALITFLGILTYHIFQQVKNTKLCKKVPNLTLTGEHFNDTKDVNESESPTDRSIVTVTEVAELREPLLEDETQPDHHTI